MNLSSMRSDELLLDNLPDELPVHAKVIVDHLVSHPRDAFPRYFGVRGSIVRRVGELPTRRTLVARGGSYSHVSETEVVLQTDPSQHLQPQVLVCTVVL